MTFLTRRQLLSVPLALTSHDLFAQSSGGLPPIARQSNSEGPLKVCFLYVGPVGDGGWTYAHDIARKKMEREFGDRIQTSYLENVPESAEAAKFIQDVVTQGNKLIFGTTFGYMESMLKIAKLNPKVKFEHATGYKQAANLSTYESRMYEGAFLAGMLAGGMTKSNILGFVAPIPIPEIIRNINSFTLGAQHTNPLIRTKVIWVNEWYNPPKETEATQSLINAGADIVIQNTDSPAVLATAQKNNIRAFGWDSDMRSYGPKAHIASVVNLWDGYYRNSINDVLNNRWSGQRHTWIGLTEDAIDLTSLAYDISPELKNQVNDFKLAIKKKLFNIWSGPIKNQNGGIILKANEVANDRFLAGIDFYVKGVEGKVPGSK
jgi:simple sugar transport system substrate-binding protein